MSPVFSTPAGATVTYLSSSWPWSLHASSRNMTFWNDLLSAITQLSLFSSSSVSPPTKPEVGYFEPTTSATPTAGTTKHISPETLAFHQALKSYENAGDNLKQSINQSTLQYDALLSRGLAANSEFSGSNVSAAILNDIKMMNMSHVPPPSSIMNETILIGTSHYNNFTTDSVLNSLVDCNDFTEQKLLNIVICSISDVNNNLINGSNAVENSTFNETLRNISDDLIRLYNFNNSYYYNGTFQWDEVSGNVTTTGLKATQFESTIYFIQVITTAVVLGIIILATVIGKLSYRLIKDKNHSVLRCVQATKSVFNLTRCVHS